MYIISFVVASSYALPISAPQTCVLLNSAGKIDNPNDLVETILEYMLSIGSGVKCLPATR